MLIASHVPETIAAHCSSALVIRDGCVRRFDDLDAAYEDYALALAA
jgi:ABC-type polysaccharide/polyol phosphate transport system ATPase subunit